MSFLLYAGFFVLLGVLAAYIGYMLQLCFTQNSYVYHPVHTIDLTPDNAGMAYETVEFEAADGVRLSGWFIPAESKARASILFCHGNANNMSGCIDHIKTFHKLAIDVLVFDYRGYGNSAGKPCEAGTYMDSDAAWDYLSGQKGVPPGKILVFGYSLGGAIAARLAALKKPGALVLLSSFTSMPELAGALYPYLPIKWLCRFKYDTIAYLQKTTCPVLVAHSVNDDVVPYVFGRKLFTAVSNRGKFLEMKGTHASCISETSDDYLKTLDEFIDECFSRNS